MVSPKVHVKALGKTNAVICEFAGCEHPAQYLFGTGVGSIRAWCSQHARDEAHELRVALPDLIRLNFFWQRDGNRLSRLNLIAFCCAVYWVQLYGGGDLEQFQCALLKGRGRGQHLQGSEPAQCLHR